MSGRLLAFIALSVAMVGAGDALAGPNEDGVIILHAVPYQSRSGQSPCSYDATLNSCSEANYHITDGNQWNWFVLGVFPAGRSPRVMGATFGIDYDDTTVYLLDLSPCTDFELPTADWPRPGQGTAVTWSTPQTDMFVKMYAFAGYEYYGTDTSFCLTPHPSQGGYFADDSVPSILDPIVDYGCLGFNGDPGYLPCPPGAEGACCIPGAGCVVLSEDECVAGGGDWIGPGVPCDPNPCAVPVVERSWGTVKRDFR
ncbi:MAG: hypothetical protein KDA27_19220 [Candidatus Eisenbacteria bacterium]|uniref:Uncharacterized protein n=1 Tax=Eiseniibacteriota bacterium TaxID=2212470 RepID=A0A956NFI4_UNCEI|nr:hypothetical protein [Candidatus Eisenbacteria bacterium]MCB9464609.1 hypothetical protein [Candidatus Eisenbacteria bacterium]